LLCRNRAAAQDVDLAVTNRDDGRFDSVRGRTTFDNQRNSILQIIQNMLRGCRANTTEAVCTRRRERLSKFSNNFRENWMRAETDGDSIKTGGHNFGNDLPFR